MITPRASWIGVLVCSTALFGSGRIEAQAPTAGDEAFEVASVTPNAAGLSRGSSIGTPPGRFYVINQSLRTILRYAFQLTDARILGIPGWANDAYFDINARLPDGAPSAAWPAMLRRLLYERFALKTHVERRESDVLLLTRARPDSALGPGLRPSVLNCSRTDRLDANGPAEQRNHAPQGATCGMRTGPGFISAGGVTIDAIVSFLSLQAARPVLNSTGLEGPFDVELTYDLASLSPLGQPTLDSRSWRSVGPSIFTAAKEQLGLQLSSSRAPVEHVAIDHIERPLPD